MIDEVANGLSYYDYTFFSELPRLLRRGRGSTRQARSRQREPADIDVPARRLLDRRRSRRQSVRDRRGAQRGDAAAERARRLRIISTELHELGGELSHQLDLDARQRRAQPTCRAFDRQIDGAARRALPARDRRHLFAARQDRARTRSCGVAAAADHRRAAPTERAEEFGADLATISHSLETNGRAILARGRLRALRRASTCLAFIWRPRPAAELGCPRAHGRRIVRRAVPGTDYLKLDEDGAHRAAAPELRRRARCSRHSSPMARRRPGNSRFSAPARRSARPMAPARSAPRSFRSAEGVSDMLELALMLKEVGLVTAEGTPAQHGSAVRDHRGPAHLRRRDGPAPRRCPNIAAASIRWAASRK